jgi:hypothetical protein
VLDARSWSFNNWNCTWPSRFPIWLNVMDELLMPGYEVSLKLTVSWLSEIFVVGSLPSCKRLTTSGARKWLFFRMCPFMALDMFKTMERIRAISTVESLSPSFGTVSRSCKVAVCSRGSGRAAHLHFLPSSPHPTGVLIGSLLHLKVLSLHQCLLGRSVPRGR